MAWTMLLMRPLTSGPAGEPRAGRRCSSIRAGGSLIDMIVGASRSAVSLRAASRPSDVRSEHGPLILTGGRSRSPRDESPPRRLAQVRADADCLVVRIEAAHHRSQEGPGCARAEGTHRSPTAAFGFKSHFGISLQSTGVPLDFSR